MKDTFQPHDNYRTNVTTLDGDVLLITERNVYRVHHQKLVRLVIREEKKPEDAAWKQMRGYRKKTGATIVEGERD